MTTYEDIGLNRYYQPIDAPVTRRSYTSPYDFDSQNERGIIHTTLVQQISADKITAGIISAFVNVGTSSAGTVSLDGANNRIVIHDGTVERIWIGNLTP